MKTELFLADTRTHIKLIVTLHNFKKVPKILLLFEESICLDEFDVTKGHTSSFFLSSIFNQVMGKVSVPFGICSNTMSSHFTDCYVQTIITLKSKTFEE